MHASNGACVLNVTARSQFPCGHVWKVTETRYSR